MFIQYITPLNKICSNAFINFFQGKIFWFLGLSHLAIFIPSSMPPPTPTKGARKKIGATGLSGDSSFWKLLINGWWWPFLGNGHKGCIYTRGLRAKYLGSLGLCPTGPNRNETYEQLWKWKYQTPQVFLKECLFFYTWKKGNKSTSISPIIQ